MSKKNLRRNKGKVKRNYIKDKAVVEFILQHSQKERIDFSKIKIPSFLDISADEERPTVLEQFDSNKNQGEEGDEEINNKYIKQNINKIQQPPNMNSSKKQKNANLWIFIIK